MDNDELIRKLEEFKDYLHIGNIFVDPFRWLGGVFLKGLALILDGLEKVTDEVLLIRRFFQNPEIVAFVDSIRPFLYILLAFSILYTGYLLIFQKKFNREGIAINLFIAMAVIALLSTGMEKSIEFTDEAKEAIGTQQLYGEEQGTVSQNILSRNIYDLTEFDKNGWSSTELARPNTIPLDMIGRINLTEKFDSSRSELNMSSSGKDLSKAQLIWVGDKKDTTKFDQSGLEWNNEYYYRYSVDWFTLLTTIIVMAFTLFSIAYKLARLSFEMTFNYVLAIIVAPADIHDGQKTKKILQSIFNTFLVIILIFLSMKIYMIGTGVIADQLDGIAYLIALIAFSVAVIDGPNIVERLFGIDAGLKSGWGVLAGAYAGGKVVTGIGRSLASLAKKSNNKNSPNSSSGGGGGSGGSDGGNKPPSPNDKDNKNKCPKCGQSPCVCSGGGSGGSSGGGSGSGSSDGSVGSSGGSDTKGDGKDSKGSKDSGSGGSSGGSVAQQAEEQQGKQRNTTSKAPSPNDGDKTTSSSSVAGTAKVSDNATVRQDTGVTGVQNTVQGNTTGSTTNTGGSPTQAPTGGKPTATNTPKTTSSSGVTETAKVTDNSTVRKNTEVASEIQEVAGNTTTSSIRTGSSPTPTNAPASGSSGVGNSIARSGSHSTEKTNITTNSTVTTDTEISNHIQDVGGSTKTTTTNSGSSFIAKDQPHVNERKRPRNYSISKGNENIIEKMKRHKKK